MFGIVIGAAGIGLCRAILLRALRTRHPGVFFSELGAPRLGQLAARSLARPMRNLQWRFLKFLWTGEFLRLRDPIISGIGAMTFMFEFATIGLLGMVLVESLA